MSNVDQAQPVILDEEFEAALLKGLNTGTEIEMTAEEWKRLRDEYEAESHSECQAS